MCQTLVAARRGSKRREPTIRLGKLTTGSSCDGAPSTNVGWNSINTGRSTSRTVIVSKSNCGQGDCEARRKKQWGRPPRAGRGFRPRDADHAEVVHDESDYGTKRESLA
jgi:hypothetical protein